MKSSLRRVMQCSALSLAVMCVDGHAMVAGDDLMERGETGMTVRSASVFANQCDYEVSSYLNLEIENNVSGVRAKGVIKGMPLYICLSSVCVVGGLSVLHFVGLI